MSPTDAARRASPRPAWLIVAESAAAPAGIPKRVSMDVRALLAAGEDVVVLASDADRLTASLPAGQPGRLATVAFDARGTFVDRAALKLAHVLRARGLYDDIEEIAHLHGLGVGAEHVLREVLRERPVRAIIAHDATFVHAARRALREASAGRRVALLYVVHAIVAERVLADASPHGRLTTRRRAVVERAALRGADHVLPVSEATAEVCIAEGARRERVHVRHNAIELPEAAPVYDDTARDLDLLYVGRLSTEKGIETLLDAIARVDAPLRLTIAGSGPLDGAVRAAAMAMPDRIDMLGLRSQREVAALFARARLAVVPSLSEPFGFVVLEALAHGTPVVAAAVGGILEIAAHEGGTVLVPPRDAARLAEELARLAASPGERARLSRAALARAGAFAFEHAGPETVALYRACAGVADHAAREPALQAP